MKRLIAFFAFPAIFLTACTISYGFQGTKIDYTVVKTLSINDFTNQAEYIYDQLEYIFNEELKNTFRRQTKLNFIPQSGDLHLEGEIVGYRITPLGVRDNNLAASTQLTLTVKVRYTNNKAVGEDFEQTFNTSETFDSNRMLSDVEPELVPIMVKNLIDMIFNATVANW
ncbi:MAG: LPS assembly lipoprotein LptE [Bacteroidales bacterium]|jgi:hypothetical protein|nr:LPS assembly lipoprotein LptE [Bacteroidales bacterium]